MCNRFIISFLRHRLKMVPLSLALLCMLGPGPVRSQCGGNSTQDTDFWLMFLTNYSPSNDLSVVVAADRNTHVPVTNSYHNIYDTYTVPAQGTVTLLR